MRKLFCLMGFAALLVMSSGFEDVLAGGYEVVPTPEDCKCLPYYQCPNGTVIDDGTTLIDIRIRVEACENYLEVCCKTRDVFIPDDKEKEGHEETVEPGHEEEHDPEVPSYWGSCGVRHPKGVAFRITGDNDGEAQFGEFPWMAAVLLKKVEGGRTRKAYLCGGALIHPHVILTGAHCIASHTAEKLLVRVGEWDSQTTKEIYPYQEREVHIIIIHKDFKKNNLHNDIALLYFAEPMVPEMHIGIVCLPKEDHLPADKTRCFASGWGRTEFDLEGKYSTILKSVEMPVVDHDKCQYQLRKTRLGAYFKLHQSFMCAGGEEGKDTCKGDGGSPLVCPHPEHPDHYIQSGIVAWGIGCKDQDVPGVYVDVAHFRHWIDEKMKELDLDSYYYSLKEF